MMRAVDIRQRIRDLEGELRSLRRRYLEQEIADPEGVGEVLVVRVCGRQLGFFLSDIKEIFRMVYLSQLPGGERVLAGVLNLRGDLIPVVDLAVRFELGQVSWGIDDYIVVLDAETYSFGVAVNELQGFVSTSPEHVVDVASLEPFQSLGTSVVGCLRLRGGPLVAVLEPAGVFGQQQHQQVMTAVGER